MISIVIPFHWMKNWDFFMKRCLQSIELQTYKDYEIILMKVGSMPETSNRVIQAAKGDIIKVLYVDDYLAHPDALKVIAENFKKLDGWMVTACEHRYVEGERFNPHYPIWTESITKGMNTIGSPSVLCFKNEDPLLFDEKLSWTLDCELYTRLFKRYGKPAVLNDINVVIGLHDGQATNIISQEQKVDEVNYLINKHA
jgi:hypothetical protein